ncbi:GlxA family transcriptional regulator [Ruegeria lacuscaerulensis]|uniref:GlxA family transcriptional regulator n=1 Tax=Ruegeria lacuscaerulensis TaxID=55218 RepID=UPI00147F7847|nr:GlxA family transcriptional regulator [Ruegeria lacuscaerulensis]
MKHFGEIRGESENAPQSIKPLEFIFLLCPGFSLLDLASAIEPLASVNRLTGQVRYKWRVLSKDGKDVPCTIGVSYPADGAIDDDASCDRLFICAFDDKAVDNAGNIVGWLRRRARMGTRFGALGTGATWLVRAGIVGTRAFTLHWSVRNSFFEMHPDHKPAAQIFTSDERFITCAGGQSVSDMMLNLIKAEMGKDIAAKVADHMISGHPRTADTPQRLCAAHRYGTRNAQFLSIMETLEADETCEVTIDDLIRQHAISRRQLERLFNRHCGTSPSRFIKQVRLERAKELLSQTRMSVLEVSVACGFGSVANFSKSFSERYNCRPSNYQG